MNQLGKWKIKKNQKIYEIKNETEKKSNELIQKAKEKGKISSSRRQSNKVNKHHKKKRKENYD